MTVTNEHVEETKVNSKSSDFDDSSKRMNSSSLSPAEVKQLEVDDIDTVSDFVMPSIPLESNNEINGSPVKGSKRTEDYDREEILRQLANLRNSEGERQMILDIIGLKVGSKEQETNISTESSKVSEMLAQDYQKLLVDGLRESLKAVPDSILHLLTGWFRPGDCGRSSDQKPDWLDMDKLRRGQKFAQDNMFPVLYTELIGMLALFNFDDALKPIIISGNSSTPDSAFKRYLSTARRMRHWYTQDPWMKGTDASKDISAVRTMHLSASRKLNGLTINEMDNAAIIPNAWCPTREILLKDFSQSCEAPLSGQCPHLLGKNNPNRPHSINQMEMAGSQWTSVGLITLYPNRVGIHNATDEDIEAFCHLWRSLGYQLGIEDKYNICRGTLEEIRERCRDFLVTWVKPNFREITPAWEHMGRCLITGFSPLAPFASYEAALFHVLEIIELEMPRLYASLSYKDWIIHNLMRSLLCYGTKIPGITGMLNTILKVVLNRAEKLTPKEIEATRIKLSNYTGNNTKSKWNS